MFAARTALVSAALALFAAVPATASATAPPASTIPVATATAKAAKVKPHRARATRHPATACSSRLHHRLSARARRACLARRRARHHHKVQRRHSTGPSIRAPKVNTSATSNGSAASAPPPVASTAPCADGDLIPDPGNLARVNAATLCLVNQVRGQHGLGELVTNPQLQQAAQAHTDDMIAKDYFAHVGPAGDDPLARMTAAGYVTADSPGYALGENIAWGTLTLSTPAATVKAWVNSPEHLANILDAAYRESGMAASAAAPASLAQGQAGAVYTQDFGVING